MARSGRHAAADGSFRRSVRGAALRGAVLLAIAVILGIVLLQSADDNDAFSPVRTGPAGEDGETATATTTRPPRTTTTTQALRPAAEVKVLAVNGTSVRGLAGQFKDRLRAAGYNALAPTDALKKPQAASAVYYVAGYEAEARAVAQLLEIPAVAPMPTPAPVASLQSANVVVMVGSDKAPASTTATTVRRSSPATTASAPRSTTTTR
jgi:hypothetical protein